MTNDDIDIDEDEDDDYDYDYCELCGRPVTGTGAYCDRCNGDEDGEYR